MSIYSKFCRALRRVLPAGVFLFVLARSAAAQQVRVVTFNVEVGIGTADSVKGRAQRATLKRVNADIVAFQELTPRTSNEWVRLAEDLGYPHRVWGPMGPFAGSMAIGYFSRFPILESGTVSSPAGTKEFSRLPLRIMVQVPGAMRPLTLWNMHHKALYKPADEFRRAVEAYRIVQDVLRERAEHPDRPDQIVMGDMNDDIARDKDPLQAPQTGSFGTLPDSLPKNIVFGKDLPSPLSYRAFPIDAYCKMNSSLSAVEAFREGTSDSRTHLYTQYRLDYLFVSDTIRGLDGKRPVGEIYYSETDRGGGFPKAGSPLPPGTSLEASDHYPVFADLLLQGEEAPKSPKE